MQNYYDSGELFRLQMAIL